MEHLETFTYTITYWLVVPNETRRRFTIKWRKKDADGKVVGHGTYEYANEEKKELDTRVSLLNKIYKDSKGKKHSAIEREFRQLLKELQAKEEKRRDKNPVDTQNMLLLETYWERHYTKKKRRLNVDLSSARNECLRAIKSVGTVSLVTGGSGEIQDSVWAYCEGEATSFNKYIYRLRAILRANKIYDKAEELDTEREPPKDVTHIDYHQLDQLLQYIEENGPGVIAKVSKATFKALIGCSFWSGLREGEAVATNESYFDKDSRILRVDWQIDMKGNKRLPKWGKRRKTHIPKQGVDFFYAWVKAKDRDQLDRKQATKKIKEFCQKIFTDPLNHISHHGLRHSYANVMLRHFEDEHGRRFTLDDVADFLGDHPMTAKKSYAGFVPDRIAFERAKKITDNVLK